MSVSSEAFLETTLVVSAPVASFDLAASSLSKHFGWTHDFACSTLSAGRITVESGERTRRILALLRAMGVACEPEENESYSVSIRAPKASASCIVTLARILGQEPDRVARSLSNPWGHILTDLSRAEVDRLRNAVRRHPTFCMTEVANADAVVDIFGVTSAHPREARALSCFIAQRGLKSCQLSGALIGNLTLSSANQIIDRFADCGLVALPRAFQRFDLYLTGIGNLTAAEVMDFLIMRGDQSGRMAESISVLAPLRVETDLGRAAAVAFCADYASIGLQVSLRFLGANS